MDENDIGGGIVDAAIAADRELGPGLLETACEVVLLMVLAILASWREAIWIRVRCYKNMQRTGSFFEKSPPDARYYGLKILSFGKKDYAVLLTTLRLPTAAPLAGIR